jgi:hypothetical protein
MIDTAKIQANVFKLLDLHKNGKLGGEKMPEDENPSLNISSKENYLYFTLPMALNYQRNSYKLWESAAQTYQDKSTADCYCPQAVLQMPIELLREKLLKYKVILQPNKQPVIWRTLCLTIHEQFNDDIRNLFIQEKFSVANIKNYIVENKIRFPYLGGKKILNYWLYVLEQYTDITFTDRENITIAPDTHIIQASHKLGIIEEAELDKQDLQDIVAERWREICPIDIHTRLYGYGVAGNLRRIFEANRNKWKSDGIFS